MNFYPAEVVTPPLALVALLGRPDLHAAAGEFLRSQHKPPINSIGVAEPASAARLFGERKPRTDPAGPSTGIIKADWFAKHRQRRPAVAAVFLDREAVTGDPSAWSRACAALEAVRAAVKPRGARIVVAVVQDAPAELDLPDERAAMLARQAGVDKNRGLVAVCLGAGAAGFAPLGAALYEQAAAFYADDARRVLQVHAERKGPPPEASVRTAFKAAALAEFRADWSTAARMYATAYSELLKVGVDGAAPLQRHFEVAACAELFHVKVVTLLLHQRRLPDAIAQFRTHLTRFRRPAALQGAPPGAAGAHAGWLGRQYAAMAELLSGRIDPAAIATDQRDGNPASLFLAAANAAIERRHCAQAARLARRSPTAAGLRPEGVGPGRFVGTHAAKGPPPRPLSDAEYAEFLEGQEAAVDHARAAIELLGAAHELFKRGPARPGRLLYHVGGLMAREYLAAGDAASAAKLLVSVAALYRRERWHGPLAASLLEAREAASRLGDVREHVAASLEVAALPQALDPPQASAIAEAAVATLTTPQSPKARSPHSPPGATPPASPAAGGSPPAVAATATAEAEAPAGFHYTVGGADVPGLAACFALAAGFVPPGASALQQRGRARLGLALRSNTPADLPVTSVTVELADADGSVTGTAVEAPELLSHSQAAATTALGGEEADTLAARLGSGMHITETGSVTALEPRQWRAWAVDATDRRPGRLALRSVTLHVAPAASFTWALPDVSQGPPVLGDAGDDFAAERPPFSTGSGVAAGMWHVDVLSRHTPPELQVEAAGYAIVGERVPLTFVVHAGGALSGGSLAVTAAYREGLGGPKLFTASPPGEPPESAAELTGAAKVGPAEAGGTARVRLLMSLPRQGQIKVAGTLTCQLAEAPGEPLTAAAGIDVTVEVPFSLRVDLAAPPRTAPLLLPALGVSTAAALGDGSRVALPLWQKCLLTAALRVTAPCEVIVEECLIEPPVPDPGEAAILEFPAGAADAALASPALLRTGDIHSGLFTVRGSMPANGVPLGSLLLRWRRARPAQLRTNSSIRSSSQPNGAAAAPPAAAVPAQTPAPPAATVETRLPLPALDFAEPLLSVTADFPPSATAGQPFRYAVTLDGSASAEQLAMSTSIVDGTGFVISGPRQSSVAVLPRSTTTVAWQLVPVSAGALALPSVRISAPGLDAAVDASAGRSVFVSPSAVTV